MDITKLKVGDTVWVDTSYKNFSRRTLGKESGKLMLVDGDNLVIRSDRRGHLTIVRLTDLTTPPTEEEVEEVTLRNLVGKLYDLHEQDSYLTKLDELGYKLVKKDK